jgi:hypothetical protein
VLAAPGRARAEWLKHFFVNGNCLCQPSALIRRDVFEACGRQDPRLTQLHDFALWIRAAQRGELHIIEQPLTRYRKRRNVGSLSDHGVESQLRVRWESSRVFRRFLELSDSLAARVFGERFANARTHGWSLEQAVALEAAQLSNPWHHLFALEVLSESLETVGLGSVGDIERKALAELKRISGLLDVYGLRPALSASAGNSVARPTPSAPRVVLSWNDLSNQVRR